MKILFLSFLFLCVFIGQTPAQQSSVAESNVIYVTGAVVLRSKIKLTEGMTLTEAIARVGGVTKYGGKTVAIYRLIRGTKDREVIKVDLSEIRKGKAEDIMLQPLDIIQISYRKGIKVIYPPRSSDYFEIL